MRLLRAPALRVVAAVSLALLAATTVVRCSKPAFGPEVHAWGRYQLCLRRLADTCRTRGADAGCRTLAVDDSQAPNLGVQLDAGTFLWTREALPALEGRQQGPRFEVVSLSPNGSVVCGCDVRETIRGELLREALPAAACAVAPGDPDSCGPSDPDAGAPFSRLFDGGPPGEDWLGGATEPLDPAVAFPGLRAWVVDEVTPSAEAPDGGCACVPCRVEYEAEGRL
jgi:hypothetical protein